ncbi:GyrI-like domain-containing protein [Flagellimonas sp. HMM57]|uniref:GyrI-like domain-containing protein n=1 Tax=unclassified Flagellimonas TaxID=2644544 RepID=UPI0013D1553F|nr:MULTISPECIES: GyrI-like domain-containing protein [unclassified Flagellimonas]UII74611.1 GyrI-like domain-containing protein [Flagellimonas sp. HMM57]
MKRKISLVLFAVLSAALIWYLFIKPADYLVSFTVNTFPGTVNKTIKNWEKSMVVDAPLKEYGIRNIEQQLRFGDSIVKYDWKIIPLTDSTSKVKVHIKDLDHSLMNKIMIPFTSTVIEERSKKNLLNFNKYLNEHLKKFKVKIVGEDNLKSTYCAYIEVKGLQSEKAFGMMRDFPFLSGFVKENDLKVNGSPFVELTKWNMESDSIEYNFCFPILKQDSLPMNKEIKYKNFESKKALKAIYNGNYITSDRAWYKLLDYAETNAINVEKTPIEIFQNNPNMGGNELEWIAEIYMPLKEPNE